MTPTVKVTAAGLGGAVATIALFILGAFTDVEPSAEVGAALATLLSFAAGWIVKETRPVPFHVNRPLGDDEGQTNLVTVLLVVALCLAILIGFIWLTRNVNL